MDLVMFFWIAVLGALALAAVGAGRAVPGALAVFAIAVQALAGGISYV